MNVYITHSELEPVVREGRGEFIVVFLSNIVTQGLQNFRCLNCGWIICQYSSRVLAVVYGAPVPKDTNILDVQCQRCHTMFRIV